MEAWILFLVQFLWQFPHFWAIAWVLEEDYSRAGFKMLPANGGRSATTASVILVYTMLLIPVCVLPYAYGIGGLATLLVMAVSGLGFTAQAWLLLKTRTVKAASRLMFGSFIYLPIVQITMMIDKF
jgi:protoheme IX farnesyltransferase